MRASDSGEVSPVPEHLHTVTPQLVVSDGTAAIAFYARAFGAGQIGDPFTGASYTRKRREIARRRFRCKATVSGTTLLVGSDE
jgi:hypothetical protein